MRAIFFWSLMVGAIGCGHGSSLDGTFNASYTGTWQNETPNTLSGATSATATIVVTNDVDGELTLTFQIAPNPPTGSIVFVYTGTTGTAKQGAGVGGNCFSGTLNGNQQSNCCDACTVSFTGNNSFSQPNAGHYSGTTAQGVAFTGTYTGTWSGTRQQ